MKLQDLDKFNFKNLISDQIFIINFLQFCKNISLNNYGIWRNNSSHCLIETSKYFYKIYQDHYSNDFLIFIRKQLAEIYKKQYNIDWNIYIFQYNNFLYQIEKREKLKKINNISFQNILIAWKKIYQQLYNKLNINYITIQLQKTFPNLNKLVLLRDTPNKLNDYAIKQNKIILIDDADFIFIMLDKNNEIIQSKFNIININTLIGNRVFTSIDIDINSYDNMLDENIYKWFIHNNTYWNKKTLLDFKQQRYIMLKNNIKYLVD